MLKAVFGKSMPPVLTATSGGSGEREHGFGQSRDILSLNPTDSFDCLPAAAAAQELVAMSATAIVKICLKAAELNASFH